jgi:predicted amidohydrolase YtcJ
VTPGKLADLVVLSEDPTAVDPGRIKDIDVEMTIVGGEVVWSRTS